MLINGNERKLYVVNMEKDLGITFDKRLEFDYHIQEKKANFMYGMLKRTFKHLDDKTFVSQYKTMARSQLDYGCVIWNWNPYKEKYNEQIEKVQRRAPKTMPK